MKIRNVHFKRDICIIVLLAFTASVFSHMFNVWLYIYDEGKVIVATGTAKVLVYPIYGHKLEGPPQMITVPLPDQWIHMVWNPQYIVEKAVRAESNHYLSPYGNVRSLIILIGDITSFISGSFSALRFIVTFSNLFNNRNLITTYFNFKSVKPL